MRIDEIRTNLLNYLNHGSITPCDGLVDHGYTLNELSSGLGTHENVITNEINYLTPFGLVLKHGNQYYSRQSWDRHLQKEAWLKCLSDFSEAFRVS